MNRFQWIEDYAAAIGGSEALFAMYDAELVGARVGPTNGQQQAAQGWAHEGRKDHS
jgi:hypothetical protein